MRIRQPFRRIAVAEAHRLVSRSDLAIFDVRAHHAFEAGHMAGARHLTVAELGQAIDRTPKTRPVLIYCYHGHASQEYAQAFADFGFPEVYSLDGGYEEWRQTPGSARAP